MYHISYTNDFAFTSSLSLWQKMEEMVLSPLDAAGEESYRTTARCGFSDLGIYVLIECDDQLISCSEQADFDDIYLEDVVEVFWWPDPSLPVYFEYEVSPLGSELPLLIQNNGQEFFGWRPWHYEGSRKIRKLVTVTGGPTEPGARITSWHSQIFLPFDLLKGFHNSRPTVGSHWFGNIFRMDYDSGECKKWALHPVTNGEFHRFREFPRFDFTKGV